MRQVNEKYHAKTHHVETLNLMLFHALTKSENQSSLVQMLKAELATAVVGLHFDQLVLISACRIRRNNWLFPRTTNACKLHKSSLQHY